MFPVAIIAVLAVPVVAAASALTLTVRGYEGQYRSMQKMKAWARSRGFRFQPESDTVATALRRHVPRIGRASACFTGELAGGVRVFGAECTWEEDRGATSKTVRRDVRGVRLDAVDFPMVVVHRRGRRVMLAPVPRAPALVGVEHAGFSRTWKVSSPSARLAHDLLHPRIVEELMGAPKWVDAVWFLEDSIMASSRGGPAARTDVVLDLLTRLNALVPGFTADELQEGASGDLYGGH